MSDQSLASDGKYPLTPTSASDLISLGLKAMASGDYTLAIDCYRRALTVAELEQNRSLVMAAHLNLGNVFRRWGQLEEARIHYHMAEESDPDLSNESLSYIDNALGGIAFDQGDAISALEIYTRAFEAVRKSDNYELAMVIKHNMASVYQQLGRPTEALPEYEEAFQLGDNRASGHFLAQTLCQIGVCQLSLGVARQALNSFHSALDYICLDYRIDVMGNIFHNMGLAEEALDMLSQALHHLRLAAIARLHIAESAPSRSMRISARAGATTTITRLNVLLANEGRWSELINWSERIRARELQLFIHEPKSHGHLEDEKSQSEKAMQIKQLLIASAKGHDVDGLNNIIPEIVDSSAVQYLLEYTSGLDRAVLIYIPLNTNDSYFIIAVSDGALQPFSLNEGFQSPLESFREAIANLTVQKSTERFVNSLSQLVNQIVSDHVFGSVKTPKGNPFGQLDLVLWGSLHDMPFEATIGATGAAKRHTQLRRWFSVSQMRQSVILNPTAGPRKALIIADPLAGVPIRSTFPHIDLEDGGLPGARREGEKVAEILEAHGWYVDRLFGPDATANAIQSRLDHIPYQIIHFAGHAAFNSDVPEHSALMVRGQGIDDFYPLSAAEIGEGELLNAHPLVVLSGCHTGGLGMKLGNEPEGLLQAFFLRGAASLLVSGWPVLDTESMPFMISFYISLCDHKSIGEALAIARESHAMYDVRTADGISPSAHNWAAFRLYGCGGQV